MRSIFLRKSTKEGQKRPSSLPSSSSSVDDEGNVNDKDTSTTTPPEDGSTPPPRSSIRSSLQRPRMSNGRNQFMGDLKLSQSTRIGLTSFDGGFNPLKDDPAIEDLIEEMEAQPMPPTNNEDDEKVDKVVVEVMKPKEFDRWRSSFLEAMDCFLEQDGTVAAQKVYDDFHSQLKELTQIKQQLRVHINRNELTPSPTVKARKCLSELQKHTSGVTQRLANFLPGSGKDKAVKTFGYTNYHMGAVLVRNGFQLYGHLRASADLLLHYRQLLEQVADKQLHQVIDKYHTQLSIYCDVLASLGLFKVMIAVRYILEQHNISKQQQQQQQNDDNDNAFESDTSSSQQRGSVRRKPVSSSFSSKNSKVMSNNIHLLSLQEDIDFSNSEVGDLSESLGDHDRDEEELPPLLLGKEPLPQQQQQQLQHCDDDTTFATATATAMTTEPAPSSSSSSSPKNAKEDARPTDRMEEEQATVVGKLKPREAQSSETTTTTTRTKKKEELPRVGKLKLPDQQTPEPTTKEVPAVGKLRTPEMPLEPATNDLPGVGKLKPQEAIEPTTTKDLPKVGKLKPQKAPGPATKELPEVGKLQLPSNPRSSEDPQIKCIKFDRPADADDDNYQEEAPEPSLLNNSKGGDPTIIIMGDQPSCNQQGDDASNQEQSATETATAVSADEPTNKESDDWRKDLLPAVGKLATQVTSAIEQPSTTTTSTSHHAQVVGKLRKHQDQPEKTTKELPVVGKLKPGEIPESTEKDLPEVGKLKPQETSEPASKDLPEVGKLKPPETPDPASKELPKVGKLIQETPDPNEKDLQEVGKLQLPTKSTSPKDPQTKYIKFDRPDNNQCDSDAPKSSVPKKGDLKEDELRTKDSEKPKNASSDDEPSNESATKEPAKQEPDSSSGPGSASKKDQPPAERTSQDDDGSLSQAETELPAVGKPKPQGTEMIQEKDLPDVGKLQLTSKSSPPKAPQIKYNKFHKPQQQQQQGRSLPGRSKSCDDAMISAVSKSRGGKKQQDSSKPTTAPGKQTQGPATTPPLSPNKKKKQSAANKMSGKLAQPKSPTKQSPKTSGRRATAIGLTIEDPKPKTTKPKSTPQAPLSPKKKKKKISSPKQRRATIAVESPPNSPLQDSKNLLSLSLPSIEGPKNEDESQSAGASRPTEGFHVTVEDDREGLFQQSAPDAGPQSDEEIDPSKQVVSMKASSEHSPCGATTAKSDSNNNKRSKSPTTRAGTDRRRSMRPLPPNLGIEDPLPKGSKKDQAVATDQDSNNNDSFVLDDDDMSLGESSLGSANSSRPNLGRSGASRFGESDDSIDVNLSGCAEMTDAASERSHSTTRSRRSMPRFFKKSKENPVGNSKESKDDNTNTGKAKGKLFSKFRRSGTAPIPIRRSNTAPPMVASGGKEKNDEEAPTTQHSKIAADVHPDEQNTHTIEWGRGNNAENDTTAVGEAEPTTSPVDSDALPKDQTAESDDAGCDKDDDAEETSIDTTGHPTGEDEQREAAEEAGEEEIDKSQPDDDQQPKNDSARDGKTKPKLFKRMFGGRKNRDSGGPPKKDDNANDELVPSHQGSEVEEDDPRPAASGDGSNAPNKAHHPKEAKHAPTEDMDVPTPRNKPKPKNAPRGDMDVPKPGKPPKKTSTSEEPNEHHEESKPSIEAQMEVTNDQAAAPTLASTDSVSATASNNPPPAGAAPVAGRGGGGGLRKHVLTITLMETADGTMKPRMVVVGHDDVEEGDDIDLGNGLLQNNVVVRHLLNALKNPDEYDLSTFLNVGR